MGVHLRDVLGGHESRWYGRVADPAESKKATLALRDFNDRLLLDARVSLSVIPVGDGMALCRRRF
jgi:predicted O-methyltransferase YrrM